jgi:hypothetical protein
LGKAGSNESAPVFCEWRWYYHLPSLALWGLIGLALVVPRENRSPQAWLILIPLLLVIGLWQMPVRLLSLSPSTADPFGFVVTSMAMAWTVVWLLGYPLGKGRRLAAFFWMLGTMMVVGVWAGLGEYGFSSNLILLVPFGMCSLGLLGSMELARRFCRKKDRPGVFMAWLLLGMGLVLGVSMVLFVVVMAIAMLEPMMLLVGLISGAFASVFLTIILYLGNLPYMVLAFKSSFYRERFRSTFGLETQSAGSPFATPVAATSAGTPEDLYDAAGQP